MRYTLQVPVHTTPSGPEPRQAPDIDTCAESMILTEEQIARRAYFNYLANGSANGNDVRDWLDAESRLRIDAWSMPSHSQPRSDS